MMTMKAMGKSLPLWMGVFCAALVPQIGAQFDEITSRAVICDDPEIEGMPGVTARVYERNWTIGDGGQAMGAVSLRGTGIGSSNDFGIVYVDTDSKVHLVFQEGEPAAGGTFSGENAICLSGRGDFAARIGVNAVPNFYYAIVVGNAGGANVVAAGGGDASAEFGPGAFFDFVHDPKMNQNGQFAFQARVFGINEGPSSASCIYTSNGIGRSLAIRSHQNYPGMPPPREEDGEPPYFSTDTLGNDLKINEAGDLVFRAGIRGTANNEYGAWLYSGGTVTKIVQGGDPSPVGGATTRFVYPILSFAGNRVALSTILQGQGITSANDECFWIYSGGSPSLVAREGDPAPLGSGVPAANFTDNVKIGVSAAGTAVVWATLSDRSSAVWSWDGGLTYLGSTGGAVPGIEDNTWDQFINAAISPSGLIAVSTTRSGPGALRKAEIWGGSASGPLQRIAADGTVVTPLPGGGTQISTRPEILVTGGGIPNGNSDSIALNSQNQLLAELTFNCYALLSLGAPPDQATIAGQVRLDEDGDGDRGDADPGLGGATVELFQDTGGGTPGASVFRSTTTGGDGYYSFDVPPGQYVLVSQDLAGHELTTSAQIAVTVGEGELADGNDFLQEFVGEPEPFRVWLHEDPNGDGDPSDAVEGLAGLDIALVDRFSHQLLATGVTGSDGSATFDEIEEGDYIAVVRLSDIDDEDDGSLAARGYVFTSQEGLGGRTYRQIEFSTSGGMDLRLLAAQEVTVSGVVKDGDNLPDGLAGARIRLLKADGSEFKFPKNRVTFSSGEFSFGGILPGEYLLEETDPPGYESVSDSSGALDDNLIPLTLVSGVDSTDNEFVDQLAEYSISLHVPNWGAVANPNTLVGSPIEPVIPVTDTLKLATLPFVTDGLVADGVTPLLIQFSAQNLSGERSFRWTCEVESGGSVAGGIYSHMRHRVGGAWVEAGGPFNTTTLSLQEIAEFAYIGALEPSDLEFSPGSTEIELVFALIADDGTDDLLAEQRILLRMPPVALVRDAFSAPWSQELIGEFQRSRPAEFVLVKGPDELLPRGTSSFGSLPGRWAMTRFDVVAHGRRMIELRDGLRLDSFRSQQDLYRGPYRRIIALAAPNNGLRLVPFLKELNARLKATDPGGARLFLPGMALQLPAWAKLQDPLSLDRDLDPRRARFKFDDDYDPAALVWQLGSKIDPDTAPALRRVGLTGTVLDKVFPTGSDGIVDLESMGAASAKLGIEEGDGGIAHGEPIDQFGAASTQTTSRALGTTMALAFDRGPNAFLFQPYTSPRPKSDFVIRDIVEAARDVPAANVVEILRTANSGEGAVTRSFNFELAPLPGQPITGEVFWFAELHGEGNPTQDGITLAPDGANPAAVSVSVDALCVGDVVLFASYETLDGKIAFGRPVLVTRQEPLGATLTGIEIAPGEITLEVGEKIQPDIVAVYNDGTRLTRWLGTGDVTSASSSAPGVVSVLVLPEFDPVSPGTATISIDAFGHSAQSTVTVAPPPAPLTFEQWKAQYFTPEQLADPAVSGDAIDIDQDTLDLFLEYITGGHPWLPDPDHVPHIASVDLGDSVAPAFVTRVSNRLVGQRVVAQKSPDLASWTALEVGEPALLAEIDLGEFTELWFDTDLQSGEQFYRLAVNPGGGEGGGTVHGTTEFLFETFSAASYGDRVTAPDTGGYSYGGEAGYTPNVEAYFRSGPRQWTPGYGDLQGVLYQSTGVMHIDLIADFGHAVRLEGFDLGGYGADRVAGLVEILDGDGTVLWSQQDVLAPNTGHTSLDFAGLGVESNIISIRIDATNLGSNSDNVGIDNLRFQQVDRAELGDWTMLTFDTGATQGTALDQDYGDRITSIQQGGYGYLGGGNFTPGIVAEYGPVGEIRYWGTGFGSLTDVAYRTDDVAIPFELRLAADPGQLVRLQGFDLGAYRGAKIVDSVEVSDGFGNLLFSDTNVEVDEFRKRFDFSQLPFEAPEIIVRFDPTSLGSVSDDVGIDNVTFSQISE